MRPTYHWKPRLAPPTTTATTATTATTWFKPWYLLLVAVPPMLMALILLVPHLQGLDLSSGRTHAGVRTHPSGRTHLTLTSKGHIADVAAIRDVVERRARALRMENVQVSLADPHTVQVSVAGQPGNYLMRSLAARAVLQVRKVLDIRDDTSEGRSTDGATASTLEQLVVKLGSAYKVAQGIGPNDAVSDETLKQLAPFRTLSAAEVALLPASMQFRVPTIGCAQLGDRPGFVGGPVEQPAVACGDEAVYLLDTATITTTDLGSVAVEVDSVPPFTFLRLQFKLEAQERWHALTREAYANSGSARCQAGALGMQRRCLVAVLVDGEVVSKAEIQTDRFTDGQIMVRSPLTAATMVAQLNSGQLPELRIVGIRFAPEVS